MLQQHLPFTVLKLIPLREGILYLQPLQQHLPFTVLKLDGVEYSVTSTGSVATTSTVYGIETIVVLAVSSEYHLVATTPTVYGIETC